MQQKILLDTDIGSDIDDAVCLAYLLAQPKCDLLGITTVSGEPERRAMMASAQCKVAGRAIPIYPGAANPLLIESKQPTAPQAAVLDRWEHDSQFPRNQAIDFLRSTIRAHPGEVTLLSIGPLTNVALLFAVDPEIPALLKRLVMMAGVFAEGGARRSENRRDFLEWNAINDPHATAMVYRAAVPVHRSIGLDVTTRVTMPADEVRRRFQTELLLPVLDFAEVWFQRRDIITFHDPLAATTIFDETICTFQRGTVDVEIADQTMLGRTLWRDDGQSAKHEVALKVDAPAFFAHYFSVFAPASV